MNMNKGEIKNKELDGLIHGALSSCDDLIVPEHIVNNTLVRLEKRMLLRQLILELSLKVGLVFGSLAVLSTVFLLAKNTDFIKRVYALILSNKEYAIGLMAIVMVIVLIDQVVLRYYNLWHDNRLKKVMP